MAHLSLEKLTASQNIIDLLKDEAVQKIERECMADYDSDKASRAEWEERNAEAMKLALQVYEDKSFPWQGAASVKFPLLSTAALQYHSRAFPALVNPNRVVECKVWQNDPDNVLHERAERIEKHMTWQLVEEDYDWQDETDMALLVQCISGCVFKKVYWCGEDRIESDTVLPTDLVVPYFTRKLSAETRITHVMELSRNTVIERMRAGTYREIDLDRPEQPPSDPAREERDERQGVTQPPYSETAPRTIYEQHTLIDLDDDGYAEPYIVTVDGSTRKALRIVARYTMQDVTRNKDGQVQRIQGELYFVKYPFIPSPDGGFYDIGFGALLGPINETVNTAINQVIDAGTLANSGGGFLGRGVRVLGGNMAFRPQEWKRVDTAGVDLKNNIFPLPVREPSRVLLDMISLLVNYAERMAGATDLMMGVTPGQNTPAETSRAALTEAMRLYSGVIKRTWRAMRMEIRLIFKLNQSYLDTSPGAMEQTGMVLPGDYVGTDDKQISLGTDPVIVSDTERLQQAQATMQLAASMPGFDRDEATRRMLEAMRVPDIQKLYPGLQHAPPMPNPKMEIEQLKAQTKLQEAQIKAQTEMAKLQASGQLDVAKLEQQAHMLQSEIEKNAAQAQLFLAQAGGVADGHQLAQLNAAIGAAKEQHKALMDIIKIQKELMRGEGNAQQSDHTGGLPRVAGSPGHTGYYG